MRMNRLQLFYALSIFVTLNQCGLCQDLSLKLRTVKITAEDGRQVSASSERLYKNHRKNRYYFVDFALVEICDGFFSPSHIEIRSAHDESLSFSLIKPDVNLVLECEFASPRDLQAFFNDVRKQDRTVQRKIPLIELFRYPINKDKYPSQSIQPPTTNCLFYEKIIPRGREVGADASFYLVHPRQHGGIEFDDAHLVFLSKKFTLTDLIGTNTYGLCVEEFQDFVFVLRFRDHATATEFFSTVTNHVRVDGVQCPTDWLTEERKTWMGNYQAS